MPAEALKCKECREQYELGASYVCEHCFGPLEVSYDHSGLGDPAELRRKIQAGPPSIWRYSDFLPFDRRPRTGWTQSFTPLIDPSALAERLGVGDAWVKNDEPPTDRFICRDRVVTWRSARPRSSASR